MKRKTERKTVGATIKAAGDDGSFEAVIATFGKVDSDGDIVEPGAFGVRPVSVLPSHDAMHVPLGKATIEERGDLAVAVGQFNLDVTAARDWHSALKFDLDNPPAVQEWSWGFRVIEASEDTVDGADVRRLQRLDMREVSPVLRGASVGTRTLSAKRLKAAGLSDQDLRERLQKAIPLIEPETLFVWVEAVYDDVVVYSTHAEGKASRTFERSYRTDDGGRVTLGSSRREVVRQVIYEPAEAVAKMALADQMRHTVDDVESLLVTLRGVAEGRKMRGRRLSEDVRRLTVQLGEKCAELTGGVGEILERDVLPEDEVAKAAARFLASEALCRDAIS